MKALMIKKANGDMAPFSEGKLARSLERAGAGEQEVREIMQEMKGELYNGISTRSIYKKAFKRLRQCKKHFAARYSLKSSLMDLGPSGYPFEKYVGEIMKTMGYGVMLGQIVPGHCVNHEVDVMAEKDGMEYMVECKYHNSKGVHSDVKIALYVHSRFQDIQKQYDLSPAKKGKLKQGWLVTNTRFTVDAIKYGVCAGLQLLSWDFPEGNGLRDIIDRVALHPITSLSTITRHEKEILLQNNVVLCKELYFNLNLLKLAGIGADREKKIKDELKGLCDAS
jgi:hypothetical protein